MGNLTRTLRRLLWVAALAVAGGAIWAWRRDRAGLEPHAAEWPPLRVVPEADDPGERPEPAAAFAPAPASEPDPAAGAAPTIAADWIDPDDAGGCPLSHPIKANDNSGIFHEPGGRSYDRTKAERCYATAEAAERDGYRRAKS